MNCNYLKIAICTLFILILSMPSFSRCRYRNCYAYRYKIENCIKAFDYLIQVGKSSINNTNAINANGYVMQIKIIDKYMLGKCSDINKINVHSDCVFFLDSSWHKIDSSATVFVFETDSSLYKSNRADSLSIGAYCSICEHSDYYDYNIVRLLELPVLREIDLEFIRIDAKIGLKQ